MQLGNSCHLFITEFELRVDRLVRSNPNGPYNMHFGLVSEVSLRQAYRGSRILWPCGRAATLSRHPNLVGVLANSSFPFIFSLLHLFFFSFCFFTTNYQLTTAPPRCFARFCWTTSSGNQRYDHSDNLFLQQKSSKT